MGDAILFGRTQSAAETPFDNSSNGFESDNVQDAIEEASFGLTDIQSYMDVLRVMASSVHRLEAGRTVRVLSTDTDKATIIENVLTVRSDGKTQVEATSVLRVTG